MLVNKLACPHCGKMFVPNGIGTHIWRMHGDGRGFTPNSGNLPWNYGLTKHDDHRVAQQSQTLSDGLTSGRIASPFAGKKHSRITIARMKDNPNQGGAGRGGGYGISGWYNGIWCDSSWELAYLIYCEDHGRSTTRNTQKFPYNYRGDTFNYVPDFITDGGYVEIKGRITDQWIAKLKYFPHAILVIDKTGMIPILKYVKDVYGNSFVDKYTDGPVAEW